MRHRIPLAVLGLAVSAACSNPETIITTTALPAAGVRFINALPDTAGAFGLDFRFVDIVESNAHFRMQFRNTISPAAPFTSTQTQYKETNEGTRQFRIFLDDTIQTIATVVLKDSSLSITKGHNYTGILMGSARSTGADKMNFKFWDETVPDPGASVALRVVNTTSAPIEVRVYAAGGTLPAAPTWASVAAFSASTYITVAPGSYVYNVQPLGGGAPLFADAVTIPGTAAAIDLEGTPGTTIAGSAVSAFVFPRSTAGARTPQTAAFGVPAISFNWDRRPSRGCTPTLC